MNWINKLERKLGRYAIHNLTMFLIGTYVIGFGIALIMPNLLAYFMLEPGYILTGQIWRIATWIIIPPSGSFLGIVIMMFFYYSIGTVLEQSWGAFRYNLYIFSGILFTVLGAFILYFILGGGVGYGRFFSTYYINLSIFLAFAASYPDMEVRLYFVLPIKIKWMAWVYLAYIVYAMITGNFAIRVAIIASLLNFIVFFLSGRNMRPYRPKEMARKAKFKQQTTKARTHMTYPNGAAHRCAVCKRTELDNPNLEFRYCSKCNGNFEYCQDHLFTHQHVK